MQRSGCASLVPVVKTAKLRKGNNASHLGLLSGSRLWGVLVELSYLTSYQM